MPSDREQGRAEIARRGLTVTAVERVVRRGLTGAPVSAVNRARTYLQKFFSGQPWSVDDDIALAAAVGPGQGWTEDSLEADLMLEFGWRGGAFRVDASVKTAGNGAADSPGGAPVATSAVTSRTLGDTFDDTMAMSFGRSANEVSFLTGPGTGGNARATRELPGNDARLQTLFDAFADIASVQLGPGVVSVTVADADRWNELLLPVYELVKTTFVPERTVASDRKLDRARDELRGLDPEDGRQLAKIAGAAGSPDALMRQAAVERIAGGDIVVMRRVWAAALNDQSRPVRRAAARTMAEVRRSELRDLYEQALDDGDACVRYFGLRGLAAIAPSSGIDPSLEVIEKRRQDDDLRVRIAANWARGGQTPP